MKRILHLTLFLGTILLGCDKTIDVSNYDPHPLTLKVVELPGNTYKMTWNPLPTSDFVDYQLIRSLNDSVPDMLPNDTLARRSSLVTRIGDKEQNTFFDSVTIAGGKISFRLFARYRDHSVSSINVALTSNADISEIPAIGDQIFYSMQDNLLIFADKGGDRVTTLNLTGNAFNEAGIFLDDASVMSFSDDLGKPTLFMASNFGSIQAINPNTFATSVSLFINTRNAPISVGGNSNFVYCSVIENPTTSSIRLFQHSIFNNELDRISFSNGAAAIPWILFNPPSTNELFAIEANTERGQVMVFNNLTSNNLRNRTDYNVNRANIVDANRFEFAPDGSFLVTGRQGNIYNRQMVFSKQLNINENYSSFYIDNNSTIYAATKRRVDIYKAPNYNLTRSVVCRVNPTKLFVIANKLYLFAPSTNKLGNTMLEKIVL
jgi:hypothetical protein